MREIKQIDIRTASYRIIDETPGHITVGIWLNGAKCGNLVARQEERAGLIILLERGGFKQTKL